VHFGQTDTEGAVSKGLTIAAKAGAPVVAPLDGSVMFAGPFRGYGQILIVEHAHGYHSLIAGLGRIDTTVGRQVLAGEPVGVMGTPNGGAPEGRPDDGFGAGPLKLYFELRRNGQPVNPQRGLMPSDGKGQG
jgi:septal ring factor EnvC (AmiA/AmiB activator)